MPMFAWSSCESSSDVEAWSRPYNAHMHFILQPRKINPTPSVQYLLPGTVRVNGRRSNLLLSVFNHSPILLGFRTAPSGLRTRSVTGHSRGKTKFDARPIIETLPSELLRSNYSTFLFFTTNLITHRSVFIVRIVVSGDRVRINTALS